MRLNPRQSEIVELLESGHRVSVGELAQRFGVSNMTIRRDLSHLEEQGLVVRTHGGGVATGSLRFLHALLSRREASPLKTAIGRRAARLIEPGQTIMVDTGTTALEVARRVPPDTSITVVTSSLLVAEELFGGPAKVLLLGGLLGSELPSVYGPLTESTLAGLQVDLLFMGCDGADSREGFYTADVHLSSLEQAMIRSAQRVVLVTESEKFRQRALVRTAPPEAIHTLVTDRGLSAEDEANLAEAGVRIMFCGEEANVLT
jgi:DeoR/GlpR family transcriptional regulator of sugar metabolism